MQKPNIDNHNNGLKWESQKGERSKMLFQFECFTPPMHFAWGAVLKEIMYYVRAKFART